MDDVFGLELQVSLDYMLHVEHSLGMGQTLFDDLAEIRAAKFCDDVGVISCGEDVTQAQDITAVPKFLQDLNLAVEKLAVDVIF